MNREFSKWKKTGSEYRKGAKKDVDALMSKAVVPKTGDVSFT
jgi:hypothetical protein